MEMGSNVSATAVIVAVGIIAWLGTVATLRHAVGLGLVQAPNHRSSHVQPTPHSGGLGILLGGTVAGIWVAWDRGAELWIIIGLALLLSAVGLRDDIRHLPARVRFGVQIAVCGFLVWMLGDLPSLALSPTPLLKGEGYKIGGLALTGVILFAGVWWTNLFNFMDGIDGIAGSQAIFMLVAGAGLGALFHPEAASSAGWMWMLSIAAATAGFLMLNWPPARIFMGDVGSTYLAFMIFALALLSVREGWLTYPVWLVLGAMFISDATLTLLRRMLTGERWFEAHRSHAYQHLSRRWNSHQPVTFLTIGINMLWLAPLTWASLAWPEWAWGCVALAYGPLVVGVLALGTGRKDDA